MNRDDELVQEVKRRTRTGSGSSAGLASDHSGDTHSETDNFDPEDMDSTGSKYSWSHSELGEE